MFPPNFESKTRKWLILYFLKEMIIKTLLIHSFKVHVYENLLALLSTIFKCMDHKDLVLHCDDNEPLLIIFYSFAAHDCSHAEDVGLVCKTSPNPESVSFNITYN